MSSCDVAIVGAGPYGLAATAFLRRANGLDVRLFGEPMSFWANEMPSGMLLRSPYVATHIAGPNGPFSLSAFHAASGTQPQEPVPLATFVAYGRWFQSKVAPGIDERRVVRVSPNEEGFALTLSDGETIHARRTVIAAGISEFAQRPSAFGELPATHVSHTCEHRDLSRFEGQSVLVVGAGQSALESAALLRESGAAVEVAAREPVVHWLTRRWHHNLGPVSRCLYAPPDVGPAGVSWLVAVPGLFRLPPRSLQERMSKQALRPAGSAWLVPRLQGVSISAGRAVVKARAAGDQVEVAFDDGTRRSFDHVLLGTGYRVDVARYPFLADDLVTAVRNAEGYPPLDSGFQSSVPGLHFLGAPAAWSFGPLMRFVAGAGFAARRLTRGIVGR